MSSTQHTEGKLTDMVLVDPQVSSHGSRVVSFIVDDQGREIADICDSSHLTEAQARANARRLVACWNFCEGIEIDAVESSPANLAAMLEGVKIEAELITTWRQRAQQAADALAKVETYLQERVGSNPGSRGATVILPMIRAAIEGAGVAPTQTSWGDFPA